MSHCFSPSARQVAEYLGDVFDGIRPTLRDAENNSMLLWLQDLDQKPNMEWK